MGLTLGCSGKMYILVTKWRGGPRNTDAVLKFNQNTGLIESNHPINFQNNKKVKEDAPY